MKTRMSRSSRLGASQTAAPVSSTRAAAASAMDGAPGVDPDALARQDADERALLGDVEPADEIDGQIGAQERPRGRLGDEVGAEERAEEREGLHAHSHGIRRRGDAAWTTMSSGRIASVTSVPGARPSASQASSIPPSRTRSAPTTVAATKFITPMKSATNREAGSR